MAKFVPDSKSSRWVIISPARVDRPHDNQRFPSEKIQSKIVGQCVFCPGNEKINPTELFRVGGETEDSNWKIRVIPNKFPITDLHEVIIHSPLHTEDFDSLPKEQLNLILTTYRARFNYHISQNNGTVLIFNNHDAHAGASITHPHSQLVVLPRQVNLDTIPREPVQNIVAETKLFFVYCPDFSQWPYELWMAPKTAGGSFGEATDEELRELSDLLQKYLGVIIKKFSKPGSMHAAGEETDIPYNFYIYHGKDWYLRIMPRLIHRAGFELGTGLSVNIVDPVQAAKEFRENLL